MQSQLPYATIINSPQFKNRNGKGSNINCHIFSLFLILLHVNVNMSGSLLHFSQRDSTKMKYKETEANKKKKRKGKYMQEVATIDEGDFVHCFPSVRFFFPNEKNFTSKNRGQFLEYFFFPSFFRHWVRKMHNDHATSNIETLCRARCPPVQNCFAH